MFEITGEWISSTSVKGSHILGDGFKYCLFSPLLGEMIQFDVYFSMGLVQPPTSLYIYICLRCLGIRVFFLQLVGFHRTKLLQAISWGEADSS